MPLFRIALEFLQFLLLLNRFSFVFLTIMDVRIQDGKESFILSCIFFSENIDIKI